MNTLEREAGTAVGWLSFHDHDENSKSAQTRNEQIFLVSPRVLAGRFTRFSLSQQRKILSARALTQHVVTSAESLYVTHTHLSEMCL
jgi:hypothetical protein